jgi:hypothetical protein
MRILKIAFKCKKISDFFENYPQATNGAQKLDIQLKIL